MRTADRSRGADERFTKSELEYLRGGGTRRLARIATVGRDNTPHVVPVGFRYEPAHDSIDVHGHDLRENVDAAPLALPEGAAVGRA